ncbi:DUF86 domain-containing protein [Emergencia timonensis]|uniref:HepT-like ribonuclease domain-containing protein n=1 Tax=Emergencia timonensis TaxID=1776384 RepID=UPI003992E458
MKNKYVITKIIEHIDKIERYCIGKTYDTFSKDSQLVEACVFNLSQIGEMVNRLDEEFLEKYAYIPWYQIRGLRNRIVHDYEGVNLRLVWDIIELDLLELKQQLLKICSKI